ncbi:MAG: hypothetical protein V3U76_03355 [Granulosicoccus sp.]
MATQHRNLSSLLIVTVVLLSGCSQDTPETQAETFLPEPEWLASIRAPVVNTRDEVLALWQSEERCCIAERKLEKNEREFYKSCYVAVAEHPQDDGLVVMCMNLMTYSVKRAQRREIHHLILERYADHRDIITGCANCAPADTIARVSHGLSRTEYSDGNKRLAITLLEDILIQRQDEISPWVQTEMYTTLAKHYAGNNATSEQVSTIKEAWQRLDDLQQTDEPVRRRFKDLDKAYRELLESGVYTNTDYSHERNDLPQSEMQ